VLPYESKEDNINKNKALTKETRKNRGAIHRITGTLENRDSEIQYLERNLKKLAEETNGQVQNMTHVV
jgi:hypothetical protein